MILENFKIDKVKSNDLLRVVMALVFISAGVFRMFNPQLAQNELQILNVPQSITWIIIFLEIIGGIWLLFRIKYWRKIVRMFIIFLLIALAIALKTNYQYIINNLSELFVFNSNPTDIFLHTIFIIILLSLVLKKK